MIILCDIDNVLADDRYRVPLIAWDEEDLDLRFHMYNASSVFDKCHNYHLVNHPDKIVILLTAMPETYRVFRERWLVFNHIDHSRMLMRADDDYRGSVDVKRDMVKSLFHEGMEPSMISAAYDDRPDVINMYKEEFGIECAEVVSITDQTYWKENRA